MKNKIRKIMNELSSGAITLSEAEKQINKIIPQPNDIYNKANEKTYTEFVDYLNTYGDDKN